MFTLLTTLISFLTGGVPKLLDFFQNKARLVLEALKAQVIAGGLDYPTVIAEKKITEEAKIAVA